MAGRKAVPTALRLIRGNPGKRPLPKHEPRARLVAPDPPKRLQPVARSMWKELVPVLFRMRVLTEADLRALELICEAWAEYRQAQLIIAKQGAWYETINESGGKMIRSHPALVDRADAWRRAKAGLVEFGLTPASRTKVTAAPEDAHDPLQEFLGGS